MLVISETLRNVEKLQGCLGSWIVDKIKFE